MTDAACAGPLPATSDQTATMGRRIKSIFGGSVGNLVEWYDWYAYSAFALMYPPLARLLPASPSEEVAMLARTMFSAVHGIISLGLEERLVAVPQQALRQQVSQFVETYLAGLKR